MASIAQPSPLYYSLKGKQAGATAAMKLHVTATKPTPVDKPVAQMEVGILYFHTLTGSVILCTQARQPKTGVLNVDVWYPAQGICLIKGALNRKTWAEYPIWSFTEPKNYTPWEGALTIQNEL